MENTTAFPLSWPPGWKRATSRKRANFSKKEHKTFPSGGGYSQSRPLEIGDGLNRLHDELRRLGATNVVISTDLTLNRDGSISRGQRQPDDPGVAVYFKLKCKPRCMASDVWTRIPDNMAAIAGTIEALRSIDRYGVGSIEQAFAGYTALQPAADIDWHIVLGVQSHAPTATVESRYRELARTHHPDRTGSTEEMTRVNMAYAAFKRERGL